MSDPTEQLEEVAEATLASNLSKEEQDETEDTVGDLKAGSSKRPSKLHFEEPPFDLPDPDWTQVGNYP